MEPSIILLDMAKPKPKRVNEARKKLKEIKRHVPDSANPGSTIRKSFYGQTLEDAEASYRAFLTPPLRVDLTINLPEGSFVWYYENYFVPLKAHLRANTTNTHGTIAAHVLEEIGHLQVRDINKVTLAEMLKRLDNKLTHRNKNAKPRSIAGKIVPPIERWEKLAPSTVNKCRKFALEVCEIAAEEDATIRPINPKRVPTRREPKKTVEIYSPSQIRRLLDAAKDRPIRAAILIYGFLGVRLREGCAFAYTDLTRSGILRCWHQVDIETGGLTNLLKSEAGRREFPLPDGLLEEVRALCFPRARLILNGAGNPYSPESMDRDLAVIMRRAQLPVLTCHQFRHSFSSWLDENGCPRSVRLALMGHADEEVGDRYNHPTRMKEWLGRLWDASFIPEEEPLVVSYERRKPGPVTPPVGEANGRSKLTKDAVVSIRTKIGNQTIASLAREYKVNRRTIEKIRDNEIWKIS